MIHVKPAALLAVVPRAEGVARARLESTLRFVEELAAMASVAIETVEIDRLIDIACTVYKVKKSVEQLAERLGTSRIYVSLKCGLRLLALALTLVAQSLSQTLNANVHLIIDDEKGDIVEFDASQLIPERLGADERRILRILTEKTIAGEAATIRELAAQLSMPKSTVHKRLRSLMDRELVQHSDTGYQATVRGIISA
jgi:hypothetical protein